MDYTYIQLRRGLSPKSLFSFWKKIKQWEVLRENKPKLNNMNDFTIQLNKKWLPK